MSRIHATAIVETGAKIDANVEIGPYAVIGPHVEIGEGTTIGAHAVITGHTRIGKRNRIFQFVSLGEQPQDKKYAGEPTRLEIGDDNTIREFCTFNTGTVQDQGITRVGNGNWVMAYVHIAHDCVVGNHTILANNATLGGHVEIGDYAILGGLTAVHQFCKIGAHVITGGGTIVFKDIPPFVMASGAPAQPHGLNSEGLKRRGFSPETLATLKRAYKTLYRESLTLQEALEKLDAETAPEVAQLTAFLRSAERGIIR
ncbi:MAG: acyl-ACP--UDP-N-acetylglucosamine O-acyltransferase [Hydrogenophilaceae bacterium]|nr:acyl-ACP--UDP-N-acetylglucosamine O-acyltransferase [Hydrogenophilaceae bacterium]